jgi:hypothetical protein
VAYTSNTATHLCARSTMSALKRLQEHAEITVEEREERKCRGLRPDVIQVAPHRPVFAIGIYP